MRHGARKLLDTTGNCRYVNLACSEVLGHWRTSNVPTRDACALPTLTLTQTVGGFLSRTSQQTTNSPHPHHQYITVNQECRHLRYTTHNRLCLHQKLYMTHEHHADHDAPSLPPSLQSHENAPV